MTTEERVMRLFAEANPVPDIEALGMVSVDATRYLAILDQRSREMIETEQRPPEVVTRRGIPRAGMVIAAVVIIAGIAAVWLGVADRRTELASDGVAVAEEFAGAVSSGATDLSPYVTEDATFGPMTIPLDDDLAAFWAGLDTTLTLSDCEQTAEVVSCSYHWTDRIRETQERPELGTMTILIQGSRVGAISRNADEEASRWLEEGDPVIHYMQWLNQIYPGWELELDFVGEPYQLPGRGSYAPLGHDDPIHNAVYAEVLTRHIDEYAEELSANGGLRG